MVKTGKVKKKSVNYSGFKKREVVVGGSNEITFIFPLEKCLFHY